MMRWLRLALAWVGDSVRFVVADGRRLAVVLGAFVVGATVTAPVADGAYNYSWRNAQFCDDCHVHDYANEAYFRSAHAGVTTCHDCHRVPIMHYPHNMWLTLTVGAMEPGEVHTPHVGSVLCATCHTDDAHEELTGPLDEAMRAQVVKIDQSPLHRAHLDATVRDPGPALGGGHGGGKPLVEPATEAEREQGAIACLDCHGHGQAQAHRFEATREKCLACHVDIERAGGQLGTLRCQECHFDGFVGRKP